MTWMYQGQIVEDLPEGYIGFVYLITNKVSDRKYVGQKIALSVQPRFRTFRLKNGAKRAIRLPGEVEESWKGYFGSSQELLEDVSALGPEMFHREILHFCKSRSECSYLEAKEQFARGVLESDEYYNKLIRCNIHWEHINPRPALADHSNGPFSKSHDPQ